MGLYVFRKNQLRSTSDADAQANIHSHTAQSVAHMRSLGECGFSKWRNVVVGKDLLNSENAHSVSLILDICLRRTSNVSSCKDAQRTGIK